MSDPIDNKDAELAARGFDEVLTSGDTERALGVSKTTVHKLVDEGLLAAFMVRRHLRFERRSIAHFLTVSRVK